MLDERPPVLAPSLRLDLPIDRVAGGHPGADVAGQAALACDPHGAPERHPAHQPRVGEVLAPATGLPDALVWLVPVLREPLDDPSEIEPGVVVDRCAVLVVEVDGVDQRAVDV